MICWRFALPCAVSPPARGKTGSSNTGSSCIPICSSSYLMTLVLTAMLWRTIDATIIAFVVSRFVLTLPPKYANLLFKTPNALSTVFLVLQWLLLYASSLLPVGFGRGVNRYFPTRIATVSQEMTR